MRYMLGSEMKVVEVSAVQMLTMTERKLAGEETQLLGGKIGR